MPDRQIVLPREEIVERIIESMSQKEAEEIVYDEVLRFLEDIEDSDIKHILPGRICLKPTLSEQLAEIFKGMENNLLSLSAAYKEELLSEVDNSAILLHRGFIRTPLCVIGDRLKVWIEECVK